MNKQAVSSKRIAVIILFITCIIAIAAFSIWIGGPLIDMLDDPLRFQDWVKAQGDWSKLAFVGVMALQVIIAWLPGEPLEIGAGYAFGFWEGSLLCMAGIIIGSVLVFVAVRKFGKQLIQVFFPIERIERIPLLQNEKRLTLVSFIVFLIPGTPKDILTYCIGLTSMKFTTWLLIAGVARIPSVITSTFSGHALGQQQQTVAIIGFAVTILLSLGGVLIYKQMESQQKRCSP